MSAEALSIEQQQSKKPKDTPKLKLPQEVTPIIHLYQQVIEEPNSPTTLWNFVQQYLTFLEQKSNLILPIIQENFPDSTEQNIMLSLKENSINNIPWSVYNCFLTISNLGSTIAQKEPKDDRDRFYLLYVMLSIDNDSPTYSFTELLQTLQSQSNETQAVYNTLNEKFLQAFEKYNTKASTKTNTQNTIKENFMSKTITIPYCSIEVQMKWLLIFIVFVVLIIGLGAAGYFYSNNKECTSKNVSIVYSDVDSIAGFQSE